MASIVIKDLSDNLELDRKAMQAISGGSRLRSQVRAAGTAPASSPRIVDFKTHAVPRGAPGKQTR
ncbi:hypothetical protein SRABI118_02296 [Massilia sp. Bi118]|uniref:hypothetical protein n=1 Tax=Massilia sp. Bi118 TaxID=2822346 RepID=UPI001D4BAAD1|nr:hypothetical protein [Massilia sp. Bi118]CAH0223999.1 hypothetical protein SRABI118_02296 [Massilia sp. Bi118]